MPVLPQFKLNLSKPQLTSFEAKALAVLMHKEFVTGNKTKLRKSSLYNVSGAGFQSFQISLSHSILKANYPNDSASAEAKLDAYLVVGKVLGRGSFGTVKLVIRKIELLEQKAILRPDEETVIKCSAMNAKLNQEYRLEDRSQSEADILRRLYPETSSVMTREESDVAKTYIVMKRLGRCDLSTFLKEVYDPSCETAATPRQLLHIALQVTLAVEAMHEKGILHQDLKPDNLLFDPTTGEIHIADFGLSRVDLALDEPVSRRPVGTKGFSAPEVDRSYNWTQKPAVTPRKGDYYSLGWILIEILLGKPAVLECHGNTKVESYSWESVREVFEARLSEPDFLEGVPFEKTASCCSRLIFAIENLVCVILGVPLECDLRPDNLNALKELLQLALEGIQYPVATVPVIESEAEPEPKVISSVRIEPPGFLAAKIATINIEQLPSIHSYQHLLHLKVLAIYLDRVTDLRERSQLTSRFPLVLGQFLEKNPALPDENTIINIFKLDVLYLLWFALQTYKEKFDANAVVFEKVVRTSLNLKYAIAIANQGLVVLRDMDFFQKNLGFKKELNAHVVKNFSQVLCSQQVLFGGGSASAASVATHGLTETAARALVLCIKENIFDTVWDVGYGGECLDPRLPEKKVPTTVKRIMDCIKRAEQEFDPESEQTAMPWNSALNRIMLLTKKSASNILMRSPGLSFFYKRAEATQAFYENLSKTSISLSIRGER